MLKLFTVLFISVFGFFHFPDCTAEFHYTIGDKNSHGNYTLDLILISGESNQYTFDLYDLTTGEVVISKKDYFTKGQHKVIFENIKPSTYTVFFSSSRCARKGIKSQGIVLE